MKSRTYIFPSLISLFLIGLSALNIIDIINVFSNNKEYPFGSDFFSKYSIYHTQGIYITYQILFTFFLILTMYLSFKQRWKLFGIIFLIDVIFLFYPILTNT